MTEQEYKESMLNLFHLHNQGNLSSEKYNEKMLTLWQDSNSKKRQKMTEQEKMKKKLLEDMEKEIDFFLRGLILDNEYHNKISYLNYNFIADINNINKEKSG